MDKPKCHCGKDGLSFFKGRFVCGECLVKSIRVNDEEFWQRIEDDKVQ